MSIIFVIHNLLFQINFMIIDKINQIFQTTFSNLSDFVINLKLFSKFLIHVFAPKKRDFKRANHVMLGPIIFVFQKSLGRCESTILNVNFYNLCHRVRVVYRGFCSIHKPHGGHCYYWVALDIHLRRKSREFN